MGRAFIVIISGVITSLIIAWATVFITVEYPSAPIKYWTWNNKPVWGGSGGFNFHGADGNNRQWLGHWERTIQGVEFGVFGRNYEYEHPKSINPDAVFSQRKPATALPNWSRSRIPPDGTEPDDFICHEVGAGWPWVAWHGACVIDFTKHVRRGGTARNSLAQTWPAVESVYWSIPINISQFNYGSTFGRGVTMLPLRPIFPEAIYSTMFYGSFVLALILFRDALKSLKRQRRRNAGRCTRCGYQLAQADPCPECGEPVSRTKPLKSPA